jgi:hypothetical protein
MAVLMIGEVPNLTAEIYGGMVGKMEPLMKAHQGFIAHAAGPSPSGGFRVIEIWETEADGKAWFDNNVAPQLPPEIKPDRKYFDLANVITK